MIPALPDYHVHTQRCGHARGTAAEYVTQARAAGLPAIGLSDHVPLLHGADPLLAMPPEDLPDYLAEVRQLQEAHPGYVLLGLEADYRPDTVDRLGELLRSLPLDYVIGSVHHVDGWGFDDPRNKASWDERDVDEVYLRYLELVGDAAECGLFTIMGHLDLVKKFGHRPAADLSKPFDDLVARIARAGVAVEINTAGLRKPVAEMYPSPDILRALAHHGVPVTFGSDAHRPDQVGLAFAEALAAARTAGIRSRLELRAGEPHVVLPLSPLETGVELEQRR